MTEHAPRPATIPGYIDDKEDVQKRLRGIAGQVGGLERMVEEERYCIDILTQVSAIQAALDAIAARLLENHTKGCVSAAIKSGDGDAAVDELMTLVKRFGR